MGASLASCFWSGGTYWWYLSFFTLDLGSLPFLLRLFSEGDFCWLCLTSVGPGFEGAAVVTGGAGVTAGRPTGCSMVEITCVATGKACSMVLGIGGGSGAGTGEGVSGTLLSPGEGTEL